MKERVMEEVRRMFKPEFLNRIDEDFSIPSPDEGEYQDDRGHSAARHQEKDGGSAWNDAPRSHDDAIDFLADKRDMIPNMVQDRCAGRSDADRGSFCRRSWKARSGKNKEVRLKDGDQLEFEDGLKGWKRKRLVNPVEVC